MSVANSKKNGPTSPNTTANTEETDDGHTSRLKKNALHNINKNRLGNKTTGDKTDQEKGDDKKSRRSDDKKSPRSDDKKSPRSNNKKSPRDKSRRKSSNTLTPPDGSINNEESRKAVNSVSPFFAKSQPNYDDEDATSVILEDIENSAPDNGTSHAEEWDALAKSVQDDSYQVYGMGYSNYRERVLTDRDFIERLNQDRLLLCVEVNYWKETHKLDERDIKKGADAIMAGKVDLGAEGLTKQEEKDVQKKMKTLKHLPLPELLDYVRLCTFD